MEKSEVDFHLMVCVKINLDEYFSLQFVTITISVSFLLVLATTCKRIAFFNRDKFSFRPFPNVLEPWKNRNFFIKLKSKRGLQ